MYENNPENARGPALGGIEHLRVSLPSSSGLHVFSAGFSRLTQIPRPRKGNPVELRPCPILSRGCRFLLPKKREWCGRLPKRSAGAKIDARDAEAGHGMASAEFPFRGRHPVTLHKRSGERVAPRFPKLHPGELCITWIGHASFLIQTHDSNMLDRPELGEVAQSHQATQASGDRAAPPAGYRSRPGDTCAFRSPRPPDVASSGVRPADHRAGRRRQSGAGSRIQSGARTGLLADGRAGRVESIAHSLPSLGRAFSGGFHRGFGGFVIEANRRTIFHCGDSAYFPGFQEIGERYDIEVALLPIGAYDPPSGREVHMNPEEAVQAFLELRAKKLVPMHYGTFRLGYEPLDEPLPRLLSRAGEAGIGDDVIVMKEGEPVGVVIIVTGES